eukprot:TRINITY_DN1618_c0_g1_i1.p1 TRINITY_DN1618_c0_g1~~TRINITY_DN1618_c0_g1_i1.p1  ORF type:complete len:676 (+),score=209.04 TRINITY_DN1618_c0_g1_i1:260-2287(+)
MSSSEIDTSDLSLSEETRGGSDDEDTTNAQDGTSTNSSTVSNSTPMATSFANKQLTRTTSVLTPPSNAGEGSSADAFQPFSPALESYKITPWAPKPQSEEKKKKGKKSKKEKEEGQEAVGEDAKIMLSRDIEELTLEQLDKLHQEALQLVLMCSHVRIKKERIEREKERLERERLEKQKRKMKKKEKMRKAREREERLERERNKEAQLQLEREIKEARELLEFDREARLPLEREVREKTEDEEDSEEDDEVTQEDKREKAKVAVCMVDLWDLGASEEPKVEESLRALQTLSQKERNRKWIRISGAIPLLVDLLNAPDPKNTPLTRKESTVLNILATLARNAVNRDEMRQHGLPVFLKFLDASNQEDVVNALKLLKELSKSPQNLATLRENKMIELVLPMLKSDNENIIGGALDILYVVCLHNTVSQSIVRSGGGVQTVAGLIDHASREVRKRAIRALGSISSENFKVQKTFHKGPTIQKLVSLLSSEDEDLVRESTGSLAALTDNDYDNQTSVRKLGGLGPIVSLLSHSSDGIKEQACAALRALVKGNGKSQNELRNLNCIPSLINNLCCDDDRIKEHAAGALLELARNNARNQKAIVDAGAIGPIVQALTSDSQVLVYLAEGAVWALGSGKDRSIRSALREAHAVSMLKNIITNSSVKKLKQGAQWALEVLEEK